MRKLSILVPSVSSRRSGFLPRSLELLYGQLEKLQKEDQDDVEILFLVDNKTMTLGDKRNEMVAIARGEYVVFVDDDDRVSEDYIKTLLEECRKGEYDCISFLCSVTINSGAPKICRYSKEYGRDFNSADGYFRLPNHICCVRRSMALETPFPSIVYGEDTVYAKLLLPLIKKELIINRVLYHYDYNERTTEAQSEMIPTKRRVINKDAICDVIFLSKASSSDLRKMTQTAIDTCISGANGLPINVFVVEQEAGVFYDGAETIYHNDPFEYNRFMNLAARQGKSPWILFSNNDVEFTNAWLHHLMTVKYPVMSPHNPKDSRQHGIRGTEIGTTNGRNFSGWCFMLQRELWDKIGGLDEDFSFWFSDDATIKQCEMAGFQPMLVTSSVVYHGTSKTLATLPPQEQANLAWSKLELYNSKYNDNKFTDNPNYLAWKNSK